jgi:plastocyanin
MNRNSIGVIIVLIIVIVGGWFLLKGTPTSAPTTSDQTPAVQTPAVTNTTTTTSTTTTSTTPSGVTVVYGNQGFSPQSVTIPLGTIVTFVNQSSDEMWIASDPHPTHQGYDGTTRSQHCVAGYNGPAPFDECSAGTSSYSFTFLKAGTWGYHNHGAPGDRGTIIVTAAATPN